MEIGDTLGDIIISLFGKVLEILCVKPSHYFKCHYIIIKGKKQLKSKISPKEEKDRVMI